MQSFRAGDEIRDVNGDIWTVISNGTWEGYAVLHCCGGEEGEYQAAVRTDEAELVRAVSDHDHAFWMEHDADTNCACDACQPKVDFSAFRTEIEILGKRVEVFREQSTLTVKVRREQVGSVRHLLDGRFEAVRGRGRRTIHMGQFDTEIAAVSAIVR